LGWRASMVGHYFATVVCEIDAHLQQFAVDARRAPQRFVCDMVRISSRTSRRTGGRPCVTALPVQNNRTPAGARPRPARARRPALAATLTRRETARPTATDRVDRRTRRGRVRSRTCS
jgi:hypothetical protein